MKKKVDSQESTKASVSWLSMLRSVVHGCKVSTIISKLGAGIKIVRSNIIVFGDMISNLGQDWHEKKEEIVKSEPKELLGRQESENADLQSNDSVETENLEASAEDELVEVMLEVDLENQFRDIIYRLLITGIKDIKADKTVTERYANVTFDCNKSQILKLAIILGEISPPIRLGNRDKTECISEFRKQLEMAQVLQQQKSPLIH